MKAKRTKACDISKRVKEKVWERDNHCCVICGSTSAMPNAHFIPRSKGGLGIEENIITLCNDCHRKFDQSDERIQIKQYLQNYLEMKYPCWNISNLVFKK